ncbi:cytochrome P450 307a1-like isoform X2 [Varroa destructor]|uniref:unspecific monooxygenase n=1 Tax=Varroa destructor TaxID=109461 RepID=A0A7M7JFC6_VARDE|nr:cytochrome P450 307a1-like isoform X2 [Varroa destructor]
MSLLNGMFGLKEGRLTRGKRLPGPSGVPVFGSSPQLGKFTKIWDGFSELHEKYGSLVGVQIGSRYCLLVNNVEDIKEILINRATSFANRPDFLRFQAIFRWNRDLSVALSDWSTKQKTRRDILYGPLHPKGGVYLQTKIFDSISSQTILLIDFFREKNGEPLEPRWPILNAIGNVFYDFFCSKTFDWNDAVYLRTVNLYNEIFHELFQGFAIDFMPWLKPFYNKRLNELHALEAEISKFNSGMITEHEQSAAAYEVEPRDICDILVLYINSAANCDAVKKIKLDRTDLAVIIGDLIGGFPVVSNMVLWGIYMLANEPEVQNKLFEEYEVVCGSGIPGADHKKSLVYTEATMYEILRMVCSPIIPHVATQNTELQGYHIPKDTMVMFNICDLNFNPELWDKPAKFMPDRFICDGTLLKPDHFLPFGTGKRSCMGDGLVRHIVHLILSALIGQFRVRLAPSTPAVDYLDARGRVIMETEPKLMFEQRLCTRMVY